MRSVRLAAGLTTILIARVTAAQSGAAFTLDPSELAAGAKVGQVVPALRITGNEPRIDGALDDEVWTRAEVGENLVQ